MPFEVSDVTPRVQYTLSANQASGAAAVTVPFLFYDEADLVVDIEGATKTLATDYTTTGEGAAAGGTLTLTGAAGAGAGDVITIYRDQAFERRTDYQPSGDFDPDVLDVDLNRLVLMIQQLARDNDFTLRFPLTDAAAPGDLPADTVRALKYLAFDADGNPVASSGTADSGLLRDDLSSQTATLGGALVDVSRAGAGFPAIHTRKRWRDWFSIMEVFDNDTQRDDIDAAAQGFDATPYLDAAAVYANSKNYGRILLPAGGYLLNTLPAALPDNVRLIGDGMQRTILYSHGNGDVLRTGAEGRRVHIEGLTLQWVAGAAANGIKLLQARHCKLARVEILDFPSIAILLDGSSTWCASNQIVDPLLGRNLNGIKLTADAGKQCNHTQIFGGYIYGSAGIKATAGSTGVMVERGDTNYLFGTAVESYDVGFDLEATDSAGNVLICPRAEDCATKKYKLNININKNVIVSPVDVLNETDAGGAGDGLTVFGQDPYFRLDNTYLQNNKGLRFKDSGGTRMELVIVDGSNNLNIKTPQFGTTNKIVLIDRSDGSTIAEFSNAGMKVVKKAGFNNTAPIAKPTITGSRGGNAALASLLTELANYGLITDGTTA